MIKFTGDGPDGPVLGLGLSDGNLERLRENKPILVKGSEMGVNHDVLIFWGKTEADIQKALSPAMRNETKVSEHSDDMVQALGLGATGNFPLGKLNEEDEGGLRIAIGIEKDTVKVSFGKKVAWIAMPKDIAITFAVNIIEKARELP